MPPHKYAYPLSVDLGRPYHETREAFNYLVNRGWWPDDAARFLRSVAGSGRDLRVEANARLAASSAPGDTT